MRRRYFKLFALSLFVLCFSGCLSTSPYDDVPLVINEDIYKIQELTNSFRISRDAFYLNPDNKTVTNNYGKLGFVMLDKELCRAAYVRAKESAESFSHTRPNGKRCFSVLSEMHIPFEYAFENLAAGHEDPTRTFNQWREDKENYEGQGHRRALLDPRPKRIGIAHYYDPNSRYKHYWAMFLVQ